MDLIPYNKVKIETNLSSDEVLKNIKENTKILDHLEILLKQPKEFFIGKVFSNQFKIWENNIYSQNPFSPIFTGRIYREYEKSIVEIKIAPNKYMLISLGVTCIIFGLITNGFFYNKDGVEKYTFIFPILLYAFLTITFHSIKKEYLQKIYDIVEGESMNEL